MGVVGAAQGLKGDVRVKSYTAIPSAIADYGALTTLDGRRSLRISKCRPLKDDMLIVRFDGIDDRAAAAALTGTRLYVERERLPPPGEDEFYHVDLIGLQAQSDEGRPLGRVVGVENYGAGDLLEIAPETGGTHLVPFTKAFVPTLDFERRLLVVAAGALDLVEDDADREADAS